LTFVRESLPDFESKTGLYDAWARWLAKGQSKRLDGRLSAEQILDFLAELAILLAEGRIQEVSLGLVKKATAAALPDHTQDAALPEQLLTSPFFTPVSSAEEHVLSARFFHESVYEFFVAQRLVNDWNRLLQRRSSRRRSRLALAQTPLDYLPSSVYGFLHDRLSPRFEEDLVTWFQELLRQCRQQQQEPVWPPVELLRNAVEYVGMTSRGEVETLPRTLLDLVQTRHFPEVIRYNAARALERIHPSAPRPYFDYASDWHSEEGWKKQLRENLLRPWAIRGAFQGERKPGQYPATAIDYSQAAAPGLQRAISSGLLEVLETCPGKYLRINVSHALVRWFDFRDPGADQHLDGIIRSLDQMKEPETYDNLGHWLKKACAQFRNETNLSGKDGEH
jgi:hypothetical protein